MELGGGDRAGQPGADQEVADVGVGLEQHRRREQHVVDPDDPLLVELDVVEERRAAVEREVQRVVQVVIEIGAGADDEVDQPAVDQLDDAAAEAGRGQRAGDGQADGRVVLGRQHLVGEDVAGLGEAAGVERLEAVVDEVPDLGAAAGPVVSDWLARQIVAGALARRTGRSMGHCATSW